MAQYTIIKSDFLRIAATATDKKAECRVDIVVDTESDLPVPLDEWIPGSMALCADTKGILVLNHNREWV